MKHDPVKVKNSTGPDGQPRIVLTCKCGEKIVGGSDVEVMNRLMVHASGG
jgi:hypothetical protein